MPLHRRVPKFGFTNPFPTEYSIVNISRIARLIQEGRLSADEPITPQVLEDAGAVRSAERVKVLGDGGISVPVEVEAHAFSSSAEQKIEDAGGTATHLE